MDLFNFPVKCSGCSMVYKLQQPITNITYSDDIFPNPKPTFTHSINLYLLYNNRKHIARIAKNAIQIIGIQNILHAHEIFNKLLLSCNLNPITMNDLSIQLVNVHCKFPPIDDLWYKSTNYNKNCTIFMYESGAAIISSKSLTIIKEQYLHLYANFLLPTILNYVYNHHAYIFHYIPKELMDIIIEYVIRVKDFTFDLIIKK